MTGLAIPDGTLDSTSGKKCCKVPSRVCRVVSEGVKINQSKIFYFVSFNFLDNELQLHIVYASRAIGAIPQNNISMFCSKDVT